MLHGGCRRLPNFGRNFPSTSAESKSTGSGSIRTRCFLILLGESSFYLFLLQSSQTISWLIFVDPVSFLLLNWSHQFFWSNPPVLLLQRDHQLRWCIPESLPVTRPPKKAVISRGGWITCGLHTNRPIITDSKTLECQFGVIQCQEEVVQFLFLHHSTMCFRRRSPDSIKLRLGFFLGPCECRNDIKWIQMISKPKQITHNRLTSTLESDEKCNSHLREVKYVVVGHSNSNLLADCIMESHNANSNLL